MCHPQVSLILNMSADVDVLDIIGLLPHRHRIRKDLLAQLTASCDFDEDSPKPKTRHDTPPRVRPVRVHRAHTSSGSDDLGSTRLAHVPEGGVPKELDNGADANKPAGLGMTKTRGIMFASVASDAVFGSDFCIKLRGHLRSCLQCQWSLKSILGVKYSDFDTNVSVFCKTK